MQTDKPVHICRTRHGFDEHTWKVEAFDYDDNLVYTRFFDNEPAALRFVDRVLAYPLPIGSPAFGVSFEKAS